ncbi:hypothetical protein WI96_20720 [Burkholderia vietnamiensis]|uniref:hypothetical protein n=1 Tax=Burkholderia vietnamiensis TaxID=60552 RepID=UPI00075B97CA|nr:hypothetical protein [Burkholderia vietnamiensis]KVE62439.1 hypothetical protein WI96_20720 [Burkholderia vietnamiensis]
MTRRAALILAVVATGTAMCMSVLAGWQRGGWLPERLVWVAVGVVLVVGAHLLPSLCRSAPLAVRCVGALLWLGCMAGTSFGHATFFLLSQSHASNARVSALEGANTPAHRSLTAAMADRASVTAQLVQANARRCFGDCPVLRGRRTGLTAQLDALDAEASDIQRYQAIENRTETRRDAVRTDLVTAQLAAIFGVANTKLDLIAGLAFAAILEGMACLLWWLALLPRATPVTAVRHEAVDPVMPERFEPASAVTPVTVSATPFADTAATEPETEVTRLIRDIETGRLRPTVSDIRRHLRCSQAKAAALRRALVEITA